MSRELTILRETFDVAITNNGYEPFTLKNVGRDNLGTIWTALGYQTAVEVGTGYGYFTEQLAKTTPENFSITTIDTRRHHRAVRRLAGYPKVTMLHRQSQTASRTFVDESLDCAYIDGAHDFYSVALDIHEWSKKVRPGGMVCGHDFLMPNAPTWAAAPEYCGQVRWAVDAYVRSFRITPWFVLGTPESLPGVGGRAPVDVYTWCWIKGTHA